ncbi:MAG: hypothetical protein TREMPRED_005120, partial [Tremellales sp. Tagirdzhanova-0007]
MSFRQDKLIILLDTGSSPLVRKTAAKQLADLTVKSFRAHRSHVQPENEDSQSGAEDGSGIKYHSSEE